MINGADIFKVLFKAGFTNNYEWVNLDDFSKFLVLMQNTKWSKAKKSLDNLKQIDSIEKLANISIDELAMLIKPSGFYNTKAKQLNTLANAIIQDFGSFDEFLSEASFDWINSVKGIGFETTTILLNHLCKKACFVINANARKFVDVLGYEALDYNEAYELLSSGLDDEYFYNTLKASELAQIYTMFNASIDEFISTHFTKQGLDDDGVNIIKDLLWIY